MTRKDYEALAGAIAEARTVSTMFDFSAQEALIRVEIEIGKALLADNPRFDRDRFRRACEEDAR